MKKYSSITLVLMLILIAAVPVSMVGAQNNSDFSEIIQKISSSENLNLQQKEDLMDRALELHYDEEVSLDQIFSILEQNNNYNDIENQFINLDDEDRDDEDRNDDDRDDDEDRNDDDDRDDDHKDDNDDRDDDHKDDNDDRDDDHKDDDDDRDDDDEDDHDDRDDDDEERDND